MTELIVVNRDELVAIVAEAVAAARSTQDTPNPKALTQAQLCKQLSISVPTLHRLRQEGLPFFRVGDSPRFDADAVHAWLRARGAE